MFQALILTPKGEKLLAEWFDESENQDGAVEMTTLHELCYRVFTYSLSWEELPSVIRITATINAADLREHGACVPIKTTDVWKLLDEEYAVWTTVVAET